MGRQYSKKEIEEILEQDVKIPNKVEQKIQDTYRQIGEKKVVFVRHKKRWNVWKIVAAIAVLTAGTSVVVVAANHLLNVNRVEDGKDMVYEVQVEREEEAHAIEVHPTYMPEGYEYQEDGPYAGKWHNDENGNGITIVAYNAAELDRMSRIGDNLEFLDYKKNTKLEEVTIGQQKVDVYASDKFYTDSEDAVKKLYLFNEEYGYGIWIWTESTLDAEELVKIAEGLEVKVLDTIVPYATEEEIGEELTAKEDEDTKMESWTGRTISADAVYGIGEEVSNPFYKPSEYEDDIRFTVKSAEVRNAISLDEFSTENFMDFAEIEPWLNTDGTLKPHDRCLLDKEGRRGETERVNTKFLVVEMNARNASNTQSEWNAKDGVILTPDLTTLTPNTDGSYSPQKEFYISANEGYSLQYFGNDGSTMAIYFDQRYYTEGTEGMKRSHFRPLAAGESLDYTLIYVVDEDQIDNMCFGFYSGWGNESSEKSTPYVALGENVKK